MAEAITDTSRVEMALQASYQLDAMLDMLKFTDGREGWDFMIRASLPRLKALTSIVMSVVGEDTGREFEEMTKVVHG